MEATTHTHNLAEAKRALTRDAILASLRAGASRTTACDFARVSRQTFYNWLKEDPAFEQEVVLAEVSVIRSVEAAALQCALQAPQDPRYLRFLTFYLKARAGWDAEPKEPEPEPYRMPTREEILGRMHAIIDEHNRKRAKEEERQVEQECKDPAATEEEIESPAVPGAEDARVHAPQPGGQREPVRAAGGSSDGTDTYSFRQGQPLMPERPRRKPDRPAPRAEPDDGTVTAEIFE